MIRTIDNLLNNITMYRLMLYYLITLVAAAVIFGVSGIMPYSPVSIIFSSFVLTAISVAVNRVFAKIYRVPVNYESAYITALILTLIITPSFSLDNFIFYIAAAGIAQASKYILAIRGKHIFNPAAIAVTMTSIAARQSASWWVGNLAMMPLVFIGGILIVQKIRRWDLIYGFMFTALVIIFGSSVINGQDIPAVANALFLQSFLFFFAFVMLTEPMTTPPTSGLQLAYGSATGFLFAPQIHFGGFYPTPEIALVITNIFSFIVSPKEKLFLGNCVKVKIAPDTYDFIFPLKRKISFQPGQYMEWTLPLKKIDNRGNRRFFTLASSPTENNIRLGVKFYTSSSTFKQKLLSLSESDTLTASQRAGDFTLPRDTDKKLAFIAGGIGITPFRSMIKYLIDTGQKRDIVIIYSNKNASEIVYKDILDQARISFNLKAVYIETSKAGRLNETTLRKEIPDYKDRLFYLSGPRGMVTGFEQVLRGMGTPGSQIKIDYFPGY